MPARTKYVPKHARAVERRGASRVRVGGMVVVGALGVAALVWAGDRLGGDGGLTAVDGPVATAMSGTVEVRPAPSGPIVTTVALPSAAPTSAVPTTVVPTTVVPTTVVPTTVVPTSAAPTSAAPTTVVPTTVVPTTVAPTSLLSQIAVGSRQFSPGSYDIGTGPGQIPPGVYRTRAKPTLAMKCSIQLFDGDQQRSALASHGPVIVETSGATRLRIGRACPPLTDDLSPVLLPEQLTAPGGFPAGMYFAEEIPTGTYEVLADGVRPDPDSGRRCYWSVKASFTGREYEASGGGDEIDKNRIIDRPQRPVFIVLGWEPASPYAGVMLEYRAVVDNPRASDPLHVPPAEIGVCTFRKAG